MINTDIDELLHKGAIREIPQADCQFLSNIFLIAKKTGGLRQVINLKDLNKFVWYEHFKIENIKLVKNLLQERDFLTSIDLKDAYFSIPMCEKDQPYLCFSWAEHFFCLLAYHLAYHQPLEFLLRL